jgi:uncharacterized protein YaaN involved in tellurite resistance
MTTETTTQAADAAPRMQSLATLLDLPATVADPAIEAQAETVVGHLMTASTQPEAAEAVDIKKAIETLGAELQRQSAQRSQMLKQPVTKLFHEAEEGGAVGNALIDLKMKVEELDPGQFDFEAGWLTRNLGHLPFVGSPLKRYFSRYESASTVMDAIIRSLRDGREQLNRDNITLGGDQKSMRELITRLEAAVQLGQKVDAKLSAKLAAELTPGDPKHDFIQSEWLFPLRQRIMDLQQQLAVNQQAVMAIELIVRNNQELVRGVDRAINVTVSALQVAVTLALALANQKIVLSKVQAVNETTDRLIAGTAERLRTQGVEIHKQAAGTQLNIETLKKAFTDIRAAIDDVSRFRQEALPKMAQAIVELDKLSSEAQQTIATMDAAGRARETFHDQLGRPE